MDERPAKRLHAEDHPHRPASTHPKLSARERFLKELEQFAEDDEDDRGTAKQVLSASLPAAPPTTSASPSLFDCEEEVALEHHVQQQHASARRGPVGLSLLHEMQAQIAHHSAPTTAASKSPSQGEALPPPPQQGVKLQRVETYVPLSSGGFLESEGQPSAGGSTEADTELPRPVVVGDIVCRRPKLFQLPSSSSDVKKSKPASGTTAATANTSSSAQGDGDGDGSGGGTASLAKDWVKSFKSENTLSAEEKQYGKHIQVEMVGALLEVTRVDLRQKQMEVTSLDGKKEKLKFTDVRFAGYVEQRLYRRWKADPASRPVETLTAAPSSSDPQQQQQPQQQQPPLSTDTAAAAWWVLPHLVVRVMVEGSSRYGTKAVVLKVARKEEKMRLLPLELYGAVDAAARQAHVFDVVGCASVDTVVPKKNEHGLMVKGEHRGELVTVLSRVRQQGGGGGGLDDGAEITQIAVQSARTSEVWQVAPEEVCAILTNPPTR